MRGWLCALAVTAMVAQGLIADDAVLDKSRQLAAQGRHSEALRAVEGVLADEPDSAEALFLKGVLLAQAGQRQDAQQVFLDLTRRYPQYPEPFNNLAVLFAQSGDFERSVEVLKQALQTHSSYGTAYDNLTKVYGRLASRAYDRALGQESNAPAGGPTLELLADLDADLSSQGAAVGMSMELGQEATAALRPSEPIAEPSSDAGEPAPIVPAEPIVEFDAAGVVTMVEAWARAWSDQRADDYLGFYSRSFRAEDGTPHSAWTTQRKERILRPRFIEVGVESVGVRQIGDRRAQARFEQSYRSDRFSDRVSKTLDLVWEAGGWKIRGESSTAN